MTLSIFLFIFHMHVQNVPGGTSLITVEAEDMADEGNNAVVEYSISGMY